MGDHGGPRLLGLAGGLLLFLAGLAWVSAGPLGTQARTAMRRGTEAVLVAGRTTATEVVSRRGLPVSVRVVEGDEFWIYDSRTRADLESLESLGRGALPAREGSPGPVRLDEAGILRFDRATGRLKA